MPEKKPKKEEYELLEEDLAIQQKAREWLAKRFDDCSTHTIGEGIIVDDLEHSKIQEEKMTLKRRVGLSEQAQNALKGIKVIAEKLREIILNEGDAIGLTRAKKLQEKIKKLDRLKQNSLVCLQD